MRNKGGTVRMQVSLTEQSYNILIEIKKRTAMSVSYLISNAILKQFSNKLDVLREKKRELAKQMNFIDKQIVDIEEKEVAVVIEEKKKK